MSILDYTPSIDLKIDPLFKDWTRLYLRLQIKNLKLRTTKWLDPHQGYVGNLKKNY